MNYSHGRSIANNKAADRLFVINNDDTRTICEIDSTLEQFAKKFEELSKSFSKMTNDTAGFILI